MDNVTPKVYIVLNKGVIESIYSEDGNLPVVVLDMDTIHDEPNQIRKNIEQWRQHLRKETFTGGKLYEIEYWGAKEFL
jgi:hypothetical protein